MMPALTSSLDGLLAHLELPDAELRKVLCVNQY
jgi:hypothetical protein